MNIENLNEAMKLFIGDEENREYLKQAFKQGDSQYATDATALIKIPLSVIDLQLQEQDKPNCINIIPNDEIHNEIIVSNILYDVKVEMVDEQIEKRQKCIDCNGGGEVKYEYSASRETFYLEAECPICEGDGESIQWVDSGKLIPDQNQKIKLGKTTFTRFQLERLIKTCELLECEKIIQTVQNKRGANKFILGEVTVIIMPVNLAD